MCEIIDVKTGIRKAAAIIKKGGVVAFPTETWYGLAADVSLPGAIEKIFRIKGRRETNPLPLIADSFNSFYKVAADVPEVYTEIARRGWPGAFTVLLPALDLPDGVSASGKVAIRVTSDTCAATLARLCGGVITSTSANISGEPPAGDAQTAALEGVDLVLDGGKSPGGAPSTIATYTDEGWRILRPGPVNPESIVPETVPQVGYEWYKIPGIEQGVYQPLDGFRFTVDAVILANYVASMLSGKELTCCDAGADTGVLSMILAAKTPLKHIFSVDINPDSVSALKAGINRNGLSHRICAIKGDLNSGRDFLPGESCDFVISNPPFYSASKRPSVSEKRRLAMSEGSGSPVMFMEAASRLLKHKGRLFMITPPESLPGLCASSSEFKLSLAQIKPIASRSNDNAVRIITTWVKGKCPSVDICPPLIIYNGENYTDYMKSIT
ncbi:threonylcarbamoyl-AMP synthase [Myxococcota bacterium]|nr:threonylcarbamoyl-AMP synthase [Myxococcota bacterium]MBU1379407.1 threonylcarbamoyl-AMP synthase [Myxococcota bacterium]MBU1495353.1 threonylcarbamoyl-AMP synthase [Myxococcota bacterium]